MPNPFAAQYPRGAEAADAYTRPAPSYEDPTGLNEQLQTHAAASDVPDHRFNDPPPPYRSRSPTPSVTAPEPAQAVNDAYERGQTSEQAAEAWPRRFNGYGHHGRTAEQIQRRIDKGKRLRIKHQQRQAKKQAAFDVWLAQLAESNRLDEAAGHQNPFRMGQYLAAPRKRRRTELELLCEGAGDVLDSDAKTPKRVCGQRPTRDPRRISEDTSGENRGEHAPVGQRRSKRIAAMKKPAQIEPDPVRSVENPKSTASRRTRRKGAPASRKSLRNA